MASNSTTFKDYVKKNYIGVTVGNSVYTIYIKDFEALREMQRHAAEITNTYRGMLAGGRTSEEALLMLFGAHITVIKAPQTNPSAGIAIKFNGNVVNENCP